MTSPEPSPADAVAPRAEARPLRAHAKRNREKLIAAARTAFASSEGTVALESIAQDAGVGIGTLYRHFPTREALLETVYAAELDDVTSNAAHLLEQMTPPDALRAWLERYARFSAAKHGELSTLRAGWASGRITTPTRERITAELRRILDAGARSGTLRADVAAEDVTTLLLGIFLATNNAPEPRNPDQIARLLDLATDALRPNGRRR